MINQNNSALKWHCVSALTFFALVLFSSHYVGDGKGLIYGSFVGLTNLLLAYFFLRWHRWRVVSRVGESVSAVMWSLVVRGIAVCLLLIIGFKLDFDAGAVVIGFILGQFLYFTDQLIRMAEYGK